VPGAGRAAAVLRHDENWVRFIRCVAPSCRVSQARLPATPRMVARQLHSPDRYLIAFSVEAEDAHAARTGLHRLRLRPRAGGR